MYPPTVANCYELVHEARPCLVKPKFWSVRIQGMPVHLARPTPKANVQEILVGLLGVEWFLSKSNDITALCLSYFTSKVWYLLSSEKYL